MSGPIIHGMRPFGALGAFLAVVGVASPATADIWVWRDRAGVSHYTNSLENVPVEYRPGAMTVARDWERAEPPPEPEPPPAPKEAAAPEPAEAPPATSERESQVRRVDVFEAGVRAGLRAAETATATAVASSTVQLLAPRPEPRHVHGVVPFFAPVPLPPVKPPVADGERRSDERRPFQGPAGPPPLGAAGPPPFQPSNP